MEERRQINRVEYPTKSVIVVCDTGEKYYVDTVNVSPLGMGIKAPAETPNLEGKDIIIVADTLIMYADVTRQTENADKTYEIGIKARRFTTDVLEYLFSSLGK